MKNASFAFFAIVFLACSPKTQTSNLPKKAAEISHSTIIADTHIDFPDALVSNKIAHQPGWEKYALSNPDTEFDLERARAGGLSCPFMSIYIPVSRQDDEAERLRGMTDSLIDLVHGMARAYPDRCAVPATAAEVERNFFRKIISLPMGLENGAPIRKLEDVKYFHQRGIRYVTLAHNKTNQICGSSNDNEQINVGLTEFGKQVVLEMNRVGVMVDVSHLSDQAIADVLAISQKPVVATHSACRHFTPQNPRNLTDEQIRQIAERGGVVQIPFGSSFLVGGARARWVGVSDSLKKRGLDIRTPAGKAFIKELEKQRGGRLQASVSDIADHIDRVVRIGGIGAVGLGSDFDGVGVSISPDLQDVSKFPVLVEELLRRGYSKKEVRKILGGNLMRVWRANER